MRELCKVLVVDDELLVRQGIKHVLNWEQDGFQIVGEAGNGKEAMTLIRELKPHIVLTDIVMPVMDGEELTRLIKQQWPEIEIIVLSSFSEFDYVRSTFQSGVSDYILKPHLDTEKLLQVLRKTAERIPSLSGAVINGNYPVPVHQAVEKLLSRYDADVDSAWVQEWFPKPYFYLLGMESPDGGSGEEHPLLDSLKALLPGMKAVRLEGHAVSGRPGMTLFLLNISREDRDQLPEKLTLLCPASQSQDRIAWMLSSSFDSPGRMRGIYEKSFLKLLQYRFFLPKDISLAFDILPSSSSAPSFLLQPFMEQVRRLELEEAFHELEAHMDQHQHAYTADVFEFKSFIGNIVFNVIHLLGSMNYDMKPLDEAKYSYFKAIDEARHLSELRLVVRQFQAQVTEQVQANPSAASPNPSMKLLLDYIDQHYMEPITLTGMAAHFHFNPSYLSSFFAAHHHEGFKEHLNRVRINQAADLLRYSETPISEIGSLVGYGDHSYFCKVFKKNMGLSPTGYRRQHQA
ncbi:response regulator transcription factor [Paenibacillus chibensis]|uniref:response regulator transcription factor n=1 Tax=Paenibacillus chibensis TaxID=59846 RepID=UPI000FDC51D9|nr:response regulator transcription factor [Paenibacillus chibensis]MEC0372397.1 response regulator transcription factor [Paenibacillus chibensis]